MAQSRWVSLERYGIRAGFKVLGSHLFPVIEGAAASLAQARGAIEGLGFRQLRDGSYTIGWADLPTTEAWSEAFPAATFAPLEELAKHAALNGAARVQMVEKGLVTDDAFPVDEESQNLDGQSDVSATSDTPPPVQNARNEWPWLNLDAYGLEVVVRTTDEGSFIRVEGPRAAKHLAKMDLEEFGAEVLEGEGGEITITIPQAPGVFDMTGLQERMAMARIEMLPSSEILVRNEGDIEPEKLNLGERIDRKSFFREVRRRYDEGVKAFTQSDLVEMGARSLGVAPTLMRNEFSVTQRALQEQLETSLADIFAQEAHFYQTTDELIRFGASLDAMLPRDSASSASSKSLQQFSTPLSISAAVQSVIGINQDTPVWEPTAGNGSLVAMADPSKVHGMELDAERVKNLHAKGYVGVRVGDAVSGKTGDERYPRVVMNPPFGAFGDGQGSRTFKSDVPGPNGGTSPFLKTAAQDKYIALRHLYKLEENGMGAIILGADHPMNFKPGEYSEDTANFLRFIGDTHHVLDVRYVEGKMYGSHGAGWPLLMVVTGDKRAELSDYTLPDKLPVVSDLAGLQRFAEEARDRVVLYEQERAADQSRERGGPGGGRGGEVDGDGPEVQPGDDSLGSTPQQDEADEEQQEGEAPRENRDDTPGGDMEAEEDDDTRQRHAMDADEKEVPYRPRSQMPSLDKRMPANLATPVENALDRVERANGDIDLFVAKEMGWSLADLEKALAAEQVDAVALALYQAQQGKGFICGDNTGIGKGRVVAALAAWGVRHGHKPIFCTSKSDLFGDIMRDFEDIGEAGLIKPFILNNIQKDIVKESTGEVVVKRTPRSAVDKAIKSGEIPDGYNAVFMTYSQVNLEIAKSRKAQWLQRVAHDNVLLFDEVHNASGPDSNTGANVRDAIRAARFTLGSSATYAKRPDNLGLYEFTSMFAASDPDSVIESVTRGGPEYQEVLSTMLAESGQLIARAHQAPPPPKAVVVNPKYAEGFDSLEFSDRLARVLDAMTAVAEQGEQIVNRENREIREYIKKLPKAQQSELSSWKSQSVHFASQMHNIVRVANYAAKADAIIEEIVSAVEEGRRPLVAVEGTMEAFLRGAHQDAVRSRETAREEEAERLGVDISQVPFDSSPIIADLTYRDTIKNYLDKMVIIKRTDRYGNETDERIVEIEEYEPAFRRDMAGDPADEGPGLEEMVTRRLSADLITSEQANTIRYYFNVLELVEQLPASLPASPIDYVREQVASRGIKMGELTGRQLGLQYSTESGLPEFRVRGDEEKNRRLQADQFNNGDVQCLIFNSAAAEGVSLHAHKDFKNNEDRRTIFWQVPGDINVYTQMGGRSHRSGAREGAMPDFRVICLDTPTEDRMMANLEQKEGSLKANVKADRETGISMRSEPMMNRVGDLVTWEVLNRHPVSASICKRLGIDLDSEIDKFSDSGIKDKTGSDTGLFSKVTGRLCRMVLAESRPLLEQMEEAFRERIEYLDRQGINPLKTQIHDLRANLVEKREIFPRSGPSAFESEVIAQQVSYIDYIKPISLDAVQTQMTKTMAMLEGRGFSAYPMKDLWSQIDSEHMVRMMRELEHNARELYERLPGNTHDKLEQARNIIRSQPHKLPGNDESAERLQKLVQQEDLMKKVSDLLGVGVELKNVPVKEILLDCDILQADMVVTRIVPPLKGANPALPGKWSVRLESPNSEVGKFDLSLNQLLHVLKEFPMVRINNEPLEKGELAERFHEDRHPQSLQRQRWIIMGNLPKGYNITTSNPQFGRGKPGVFTTEDGRKLRGIIMPREFDSSDLRRLMDSDFTMSNVDAVTAYIDKKEKDSRHPVIFTGPARQMELWARRENKEFHPGRGAVLVKDGDTLEWKLRISAMKKHNKGFTEDGYLQNMLDGDFATVNGSTKTMEAPVSRGMLHEVVERLMLGHNQTFHGDGADADWYRSFIRERGRRLIQEQEEQEKAAMLEGVADGQVPVATRLDAEPEQQSQLSVG